LNILSEKSGWLFIFVSESTTYEPTSFRNYPDFKLKENQNKGYFTGLKDIGPG
jgi:hypothetical protein